MTRVGARASWVLWCAAAMSKFQWNFQVKQINVNKLGIRRLGIPQFLSLDACISCRPCNCGDRCRSHDIDGGFGLLLYELLLIDSTRRRSCPSWDMVLCYAIRSRDLYHSCTDGPKHYPRQYQPCTPQLFCSSASHSWPCPWLYPPVPRPLATVLQRTLPFYATLSFDPPISQCKPWFSCKFALLAFFCVVWKFVWSLAMVCWRF